jgi:hypothetical protein
MTLDELKQSRWWKRWKRYGGDNPDAERVAIALNPDSVYTISIGKAWGQDSYQILCGDVEMERFTCLHYAKIFCKQMGWRVVDA